MNRTKTFFLVLTASVTTMACGGAAVPQSELVDAKSSVSAAEAVGAEDEPRASLHLKMAKDAIVEAEQLIEAGENEKARAAFERARSDAELAISLTSEMKTQRSAEEALEKVKGLQKNNTPKGDNS